MDKQKFNFNYYFPKSSIRPTQLEFFKAELTPEMAEKLLSDLNVQNRDIRGTKLKELEVQLQNGLWDENNGEAIIITEDGAMSSGQHRCQAVINTGVSITTHFVLNASANAIETLDTGASRTAKDLLTIRRFKYADKVAGLIKLKAGLTMGQNRLHPEKNIPNVEVLHIAEANRFYIYKVITEANAYYHRSNLISPTDYHTFYDIFTSINEEAATDFFDYFVDATMLDTGHPIFLLHKTLADDKLGKGQKYRPADKRAMIAIAWNYFYGGKASVKSVKWDARKNFPKIKGLDYEAYKENLFPYNKKDEVYKSVTEAEEVETA